MAISLVNFGLAASFVTALPDNPIGDACIRCLRRYGVNTKHVLRRGERMGIYFLEVGTNQRPSNVVYDHAHSAMATASADSFDGDDVF